MDRRGKAIYSHSVNDVHFVNLSEKGSVYQQIEVEKTIQVLSIVVNYCSSTTPIYWGGNIPETGAFNITIKLTDGTTDKILVPGRRVEGRGVFISPVKYHEKVTDVPAIPVLGI